MAEKLQSLAFEAWAEIAESATVAAIYASQERERIWGVSAYLMTAFVGGNIMSATWNIWLRTVA